MHCLKSKYWNRLFYQRLHTFTKLILNSYIDETKSVATHRDDTGK